MFLVTGPGHTLEGHIAQIVWKSVDCLKTEIMITHPGLPHLWINIPGSFTCLPVIWLCVFSPPRSLSLGLLWPIGVNIQDHSEYSILVS